MDADPDTWFRRLSLEFEDGTSTVLYIERKPTGTHVPVRREKPAPWTRLAFHKCPCCPFPDALPFCPAAVSLQTTMGQLRTRRSIERVKATAVDARGRSQVVEWDLQSVGAVLVQLAVFQSDCPIGYRLKPHLAGLAPFVGARDLWRHVTRAILEKHGGSVSAARAELSETLAPLHEVFAFLTRRLRADADDRLEKEPTGDPTLHDAVPNSITQVDAISQHFAMRADDLFAEVSAELGWRSRD